MRVVGPSLALATLLWTFRDAELSRVAAPDVADALNVTAAFLLLKRSKESWFNQLRRPNRLQIPAFRPYWFKLRRRGLPTLVCESDVVAVTASTSS